MRGAAAPGSHLPLLEPAESGQEQPHCCGGDVLMRELGGGVFGNKGVLRLVLWGEV